ncbi:MAG: glycosyltransferase family 2 protein [Paludibacteraceae bacterium]|nr:glycosyltransferase family 2 protein [Paludibacteraceae bacterium]
MLVSFIIPSYNSAHTVGRCLDSIYALALKQEEFEVIFIDDCSTDNTIEVAEQYIRDVLRMTSDVYSNHFTLLRQLINNRQGAARNRGVSVAQGEYICFVDSDDVVTEGVVDAIRLAKEKQTDMVAFHIAYASEKGEIIKENERLSFPSGQIFTGVEMQNNHYYWFSGPVAYIYNKTFLDKSNYPFREGVLFEDSDFVMVHIYYAQRMAYSPSLGYLAYYRDGSTTHSVSYKNQTDFLLLGTRMLALYTNVMHDIEYGIRKDEGIMEFAEGIVEGATYNVTKSLKRPYKQRSPGDVVSFYHRIDEHINRYELFNDRRLHQIPQYWNLIATLSLNHKYLSIVLNSCLLIAYNIFMKIKRRR